MAHDAFDPGDGTYPHFPRREDGSPYFSDSDSTDGVAIIYADNPDRPGEEIRVAPMPRGNRHHRARLGGGQRGERIVIDLTPRQADGTPIEPPTIPGWRPWNLTGE